MYNTMKKKKLILKAIWVSFISLYIIISLLISKKHDTISGFISAEKMKADYEYFWDFIYNGYPFTEVCERKGADLKEIRQSGYRYLTDPMMQYGYYSFYMSLCRKITNGRYMGHLYPANYYDFRSNFYTIPIYKNFIKDMPLINSFYNKLRKVSELNTQKKIFISSLTNRFPMLVNNTNNKLKVNKKVIEEGKIAYIKIHSFYMDSNFERNEYIKFVDEFFIETYNYKHIIIDIRNNGGGSESNYECLLTPNLEKNISFFYYYLYNENKYTNIWIKDFFKEYPKTKEKIEKSEIPNVKNCGTVKNDEAIKLKNVLASKPIFGHKPRTGKKFWLLVNGGSYSAADRFADVCKKTGFAKLVGERTGGAGTNGIYPVYIVLPNSGLLIKFDFMYGLTEDGYCTDEFGTAPDIYNLPGKDALETCLEEIRKLGEKTN